MIQKHRLDLSRTPVLYYRSANKNEIQQDSASEQWVYFVGSILWALHLQNLETSTAVHPHRNKQDIRIFQSMQKNQIVWSPTTAYASPGRPKFPITTPHPQLKFYFCAKKGSENQIKLEQIKMYQANLRCGLIIKTNKKVVSSVYKTSKILKTFFMSVPTFT